MNKNTFLLLIIIFVNFYIKSSNINLPQAEIDYINKLNNNQVTPDTKVISNSVTNEILFLSSTTMKFTISSIASIEDGLYHITQIHISPYTATLLPGSISSYKVWKDSLNVLEGVENLKYLDQLKIENTNIGKIPASLSNCKNLKYIQLSGSCIETLPNEICTLPLRYLSIENSKMISLPDSIGKLSNTLKMLYLGENKLTSLSPTFKNLVNLIELHIEGNNKLTQEDLVSEISNFENLLTFRVEAIGIKDSCCIYISDPNTFKEILPVGSKILFMDGFSKTSEMPFKILKDSVLTINKVEFDKKNIQYFIICFDHPQGLFYRKYSIIDLSNGKNNTTVECPLPIRYKYPTKIKAKIDTLYLSKEAKKPILDLSMIYPQNALINSDSLITVCLYDPTLKTYSKSNDYAKILPDNKSVQANTKSGYINIIVRMGGVYDTINSVLVDYWVDSVKFSNSNIIIENGVKTIDVNENFQEKIFINFYPSILNGNIDYNIEKGSSIVIYKNINYLIFKTEKSSILKIRDKKRGLSDSLKIKVYTNLDAIEIIGPNIIFTNNIENKFTIRVFPSTYKDKSCNYILKNITYPAYSGGIIEYLNDTTLNIIPNKNLPSGYKICLKATSKFNNKIKDSVIITIKSKLEKIIIRDTVGYVGDVDYFQKSIYPNFYDKTLWCYVEPKYFDYYNDLTWSIPIKYKEYATYKRGIFSRDTNKHVYTMFTFIKKGRIKLMATTVYGDTLYFDYRLKKRALEIKFIDPPDTLYIGAPYTFKTLVNEPDADEKNLFWEQISSPLGTLKDSVFTPQKEGRATIKATSISEGTRIVDGRVVDTSQYIVDAIHSFTVIDPINNLKIFDDTILVYSNLTIKAQYSRSSTNSTTPSFKWRISSQNFVGYDDNSAINSDNITLKSINSKTGYFYVYVSSLDGRNLKDTAKITVIKIYKMTLNVISNGNTSSTIKVGDTCYVVPMFNYEDSTFTVKWNNIDAYTSYRYYNSNYLKFVANTSCILDISAVTNENNNISATTKLKVYLPMTSLKIIMPDTIPNTIGYINVKTKYTSIEADSTDLEFSIESGNGAKFINPNQSILSIDSTLLKNQKIIIKVKNQFSGLEAYDTILIVSKNIDIELNPINSIIYVGETITFEANVTDGSNKNFKWSYNSYFNKIFETTKSIKLKANNVGIVLVRAIIDDGIGLYKDAIVEIKQKIESIRIDAKDTILDTEIYTVPYTILPKTVSDNRIIWSVSSATPFATFNDNYSNVLNPAVASKIIVIKASANDGMGAFDTDTIYIKKLVKSISLIPSKSRVEIDGFVKIKILIGDSNASNKTFSVINNNTLIGTYSIFDDSTVIVKAIAKGLISLTIMSNDGSKVSKTIQLETYQPATSLTLFKIEKIFIDSTKKVEYKINPLFADKKSIIQWKVIEAGGKAIINENGIIKATQVGLIKVVGKVMDDVGATDTIDINIITPIKSISLEADSVMFVGGSQAIKAHIHPLNASIKNINWVVDNYIAEIDTSGKLYAIDKGMVKVTAYTIDGTNLSAEIKIDIKKRVDKIVFNIRGIDKRFISEKEDSFNNVIVVNDTVKITAEVFPKEADNLGVNWTFSKHIQPKLYPNPFYSKLNESSKDISSYLFMSNANRTTDTIYVTAADGYGAKEYLAIKSMKMVEQVTINGNIHSKKITDTLLVSIYSTNYMLLAAIDGIIPEDADNKTIEWQSSNPEIASIDSKGVLKTNGIQTKIMVYAKTKDGSNIIDTIYVKIIKPYLSLSILGQRPAKLKVNKEYKVDCVPFPLLVNDLNLYLLDTNKAKFDKQTNKITPIKIGKNKIYGFFQYSDIYVYDTLEIEVKGQALILLDREIEVNENQSKQVDVINYSDFLYWKSLNDSIATVSSSGVIFGKEYGKTKIVVSNELGENDTIFVNVLKGILANINSELYLYPNPSNSGYIDVQSENLEGMITYKIYDSFGNLLQTHNSKLKAYRIYLNGNSKYTTGRYLVVAKDVDDNVFRKWAIIIVE